MLRRIDFGTLKAKRKQLMRTTSLHHFNTEERISRRQPTSASPNNFQSDAVSAPYIKAVCKQPQFGEVAGRQVMNKSNWREIIFLLRILKY